LDQAAGTTGVSNALTGGVNSYLGYQNFQNLMNRYAPTAGGGTTGYSGGAAAGQRDAAGSGHGQHLGQMRTYHV
jgi:hypothetical protein